MTEKIPSCVWTNEAVTLLLTLYLREKQKDHPVKLKKKEIWKYICAELWARGLLCSWQECDKKYRNLKQTFVRNLKQAGKKECRWMFFPIMLEINKHEPFVNEMVTNAFAHSSSNTSTSDYENDDCSQEVNKLYPQEVLQSNTKIEEDYVQQYVSNSMTKPTDIPDILVQNRLLMQNPFFNRAPLGRTSKSPSSHRSTPSPMPQTSPLSLTSNSSQINGTENTSTVYNNINGKSLFQYHQHQVEQQEIPYKKLRRSGDQNNSSNRDPPEWFIQFMQDFKKSEERKMQSIQDLCDEVRRTNDIVHQRNTILNEKNELLKNLIDLMNAK